MKNYYTDEIYLLLLEIKNKNIEIINLIIDYTNSKKKKKKKKKK